jgi:hypothetical protein
MKTHALRQKALTMAHALTAAEGLTTASARLEQHTEHSPPERGARQNQERSPRTHARMHAAQTRSKKYRLLARTRGDGHALIQTCGPFTASGIDFSLLCYQPGAVHQFLTTSSQHTPDKNIEGSLCQL